MKDNDKIDFDTSDSKALFVTMQKAIYLWVFSSFCTLFVFGLGFYLYSSHKKSRMQNLGFKISAILQTGPEKSPLPTSYLAELLDLSVDKVTNLYAFDLKKGVEKLKSCPLIKKAELRRLPPSALYIDYEVRKPFARLLDYENMAIDQEGYIFPLEPFFSAKATPEIYLGLPPFLESEDSMGREGGRFSSPLQNRFLLLSFEILDIFRDIEAKENIRLLKIDVSQAFAPSLGKREIVLTTQESLSVESKYGKKEYLFPKILRLPTKDFKAQIQNFLSLRKSMMEDYRAQLSDTDVSSLEPFAVRIVDLRIPHLAFVEN